MAERKFTITWRIKNFSYCWQKDGEELSSPKFFIEGLEGSKWTLFLFPKSSRSKEEGFITCYLLHESDENCPYEIEIDYELSTLGCDGLPLETVSSKCRMHGSEWSSPLILQQKTVFLEKRDAFLPKDTLKIRCRIWQVNQENINTERYFATTRIVVEKASLYGVMKESNAWKHNEKRYCVDFISSTSSDSPPISMDIKVSKKGPPNAEIKLIENELLKICKCKLHFTDEKGDDIIYGEDEFFFLSDTVPLYSTSVWEFPLTFTNKYHISNSHLEMDKLTLQCDIAYSTGSVSEIIQKIDYSINTFENGCRIKEKRQEQYLNLSDDMLSVKEIADPSDIQLRTDNETFPAHRAILSARSLFFKNKLDQKNTGDIIYVDDLDKDILCQMLIFLYTGTIENLEPENVMKLYIASARYGIPSLKERCSCFLQNNLDSSNCCSALQAADQYQDIDLKTAAQSFILEHGDEVIGSDNWQNLERFTEITEEILHLKRMYS